MPRVAEGSHCPLVLSRIPISTGLTASTSPDRRKLRFGSKSPDRNQRSQKAQPTASTVLRTQKLSSINHSLSQSRPGLPASTSNNRPPRFDSTSPDGIERAQQLLPPSTAAIFHRTARTAGKTTPSTCTHQTDRPPRVPMAPETPPQLPHPTTQLFNDERQPRVPKAKKKKSQPRKIRSRQVYWKTERRRT